jgi:hypothetical protein
MGYVQLDKNAAIGLCGCRSHGALDVGKPVNLHDHRLDAESSSVGLDYVGRTRP